MPRVRKSTTDGINRTASATASRSRKIARPAAPALSADEIARLAYEIYERSGFQHGRDLDHWLIAERELQGF